MLELKKYRGVMFDGTEADAKFEGNWLVLSKNFRLYWLKNSNFIL